MKSQGYEDAEELVEAFTGIGDYSDLGWGGDYLGILHAPQLRLLPGLMAAASSAS